ncbi:hypothetical protein OYC64_015285 [Pagothenia borchgrevinki]|uniref:C2H2-type domain-containing protein n=2 Tax=Pagothenia borchgrevinki TaxID=8213 RepID=A0ABD2HFY8_PAGBO
MLPTTRLGKRSPLGALLNATCITGDPGVTVAMEHPAVGRVKGHPGLKVYFQCGGGESFSGVDPLDFLQNEVSSHPSSVPPSCRRSVSSCIDVPRSQRSPEQVDVDELMAAMVLSSLSCSMNSPPEPEALQMDCGGDLSDSSSGYWSVGLTNGSPTPSPPITEPDAGQAPPPDEGLDMERETVLFDEPAPRKRRNSVKVAYRCLWPSCGKVLTSVVGIKRHIRTTHLSRGSDHERCHRSEEDFYYSEVTNQEPPHPSPSSSPPETPSPPPPSPSSPTPLSRSAPSSSSGGFMKVQSDHSYQAPPVSHVTSSVAPPTSCLRQAPPVSHVTSSVAAPTSCQSDQAPAVSHVTSPVAPPTSCLRQGLAFRVRSVSVGEQWLQSGPCRRIRGEAKKCRKVYGIEHRDQWCTACRWKKACQRFLD